MSALLALLILATPCAHASALSKDAPAPCSGVLWSLEATKKAAECARVNLPSCEAALRASRADLALELARVQPTPDPGDSPTLKWWWALGGATVGSVFVVGIFFGAKTGALK